MKKEKIFNAENPFNTFMSKVFNIIWLNILWIVCCIPVITIGASTSALYYMTLKMARDKDSEITAGFFNGFKMNFKQSIPATLIFIAAVAVLVVDYHVLGRSEQNGASIMYGICLTIGIFVACIFGYVFPVMSYFENTVKNIFINSAKIAATHILQTIAMFVLNILPLAWFLISPSTIIYFFWIWVVFGFSLTAYINSYMLMNIFEKLAERQA